MSPRLHHAPLGLSLLLAIACGSPDGWVDPDPDPGPPSGDAWSDPATWGGTVPGADTDVVIASGRRVVLDTDTCVRTLTIEGMLQFADRDLSLCARWILVHHGGRLVVGTATRPYAHRARITLLDGTDPDEDVHGMGTKFLGAHHGGRIDLHGVPATSWTTLAGPVAAGSATLEVLEATGWRVGDAIAIATGSPDPDETEVRTIAALEGTRITLSEPLRFARPGDLDTIEGRPVDRRAAVARLTRDIVVQGDPTSTGTFGGHVMIMAGGSAYFDGVELVRMGQFDRAARYPFHWHIVGDVRGQYIRRSSVHDSFQRGIVVHAVSNARVEDNVVLGSIGHSYLIETAPTTDNVLDRNLAMRTRLASHTEPMLVSQSDNEAAGFWIESARNTFTRNVSAGSEANGFWYDDTSDGDTVFRDNVAYAAAARGRERVDFVRQSGLVVESAADVTLELEGMLLYNNMTGAWPAEEGTQIYRSFTFVSNVGNDIRSEVTGGGFARLVAPLFVQGGSTESAHGTSAVAIQYGGTAHLEGPIFVGYGGAPVITTHDVDYPWTGDVRIQNARFVATEPAGATVLPDIAAFEVMDDSFLPRGFYVPTRWPELITSDMVRVTLGGEEPVEVFRGPRRNAYGELVTLLGGEDRFAARDAVSTLLNVASLPIHRSDGYAFTGQQYTDTGFAPGYQVIGNSELSYALSATPPDTTFAIAVDIRNMRWQASGDVEVRVAIPMDAPPRRVLAAGRVGDLPAPDLETVPGTPLAPASSPATVDAGHYHYDASTRTLHLLTRQTWLVVER